MDEFCPLCRKNGCNSKIKPVQINFHEAVYLCESKTVRFFLFFLNKLNIYKYEVDIYLFVNSWY